MATLLKIDQRENLPRELPKFFLGLSVYIHKYIKEAHTHHKGREYNTHLHSSDIQASHVQNSTNSLVLWKLTQKSYWKSDCQTVSRPHNILS